MKQYQLKITLQCGDAYIHSKGADSMTAMELMQLYILLSSEAEKIAEKIKESAKGMQGDIRFGPCSEN